MKKSADNNGLSDAAWQRVFALPVAYHQYVYDRQGVSLNHAVSTLIAQLVTQHNEENTKNQNMHIPDAEVVNLIVGRVEQFIGNCLGQVDSYNDIVRKYRLGKNE